MAWRSHPQCWTGSEYQHVCQTKSWRTCIEDGCTAAAGTAWTPYWCPEHDVERQDRITAQLESLVQAHQQQTGGETE